MLYERRCQRWEAKEWKYSILPAWENSRNVTGIGIAQKLPLSLSLGFF
jgi:hypothetical protein